MARILVIDDDDQIRTALEHVLQLEGHEVISAANGREGIKVFEERGADLIITDIIMPDKEGLETIMELKTRYPDAKIVAISGGGCIEPGSYLQLAAKMGASHTLIKPFEREDLLEAVRNLLAK